jgi:hypothetical protein
MRRITGFTVAFAMVCWVSANAQQPHPDPPPQFGPPQKPEAVAQFACKTNPTCEITCAGAFGTKVFKNLDWAVIYKYPNSTRLWLWAAGGPNERYLLGDALCDFSRIPITSPLN